jgi:hypothetical protein
VLVRVMISNVASWDGLFEFYKALFGWCCFELLLDKHRINAWSFAVEVGNEWKING